MPITGAIFDFDGTLVDSMRMWDNATDAILARRGITLAADDPLREAMMALSLEDACHALISGLGLTDAYEDFYEESRAYIAEQYATVVPVYPGCRAFLEELMRAGVRMVVATLSPADAVRDVLRAKGLEEFFVDIVSTEDDGLPGKEEPDVYLEALQRLGTARETTWVFEDAPFAAGTARDAGFHVVGLLTGGEPSWEVDTARVSNVSVHGYAELSLALINDYADQPDAVCGMLRALVIDGSPCPSTDELVAQLAAEADYVIAADRGAEALFRAGIAPDVFCGDSDSVAGDAAAWARGHATTEIDFPSEKYATDLALAIACARHEANRRGMTCELTVTCASGGRPDHAFAVVGLLANHTDLRPRLVEDGCEMRVLGAGVSWELGEDAVAGTFSAVAVAPGTVASEHGMQWELDRRELGLLDDVGVSNVVVSPGAIVECHAGALACWLFRG